MSKKDEEIQRKLQELEAAVLKESVSLKETNHPLVAQERSTELLTSQKNQVQSTVQNDLCYFAGIGLILTSLFLFFNHIRVGTGMLQMFGLGGTGFGLLLIPLMAGIGWLVYDSKSKAGWILSAASCAVICFAVLNSLIMSFPSLTLLGTIMMLFPLAAGGGLLLKGMGGPKAIEDKLTKK